jgi:hypothetical protein
MTTPRDIRRTYQLTRREGDSSPYVLPPWHDEALVKVYDLGRADALAKAVKPVTEEGAHPGTISVIVDDHGHHYVPASALDTALQQCASATAERDDIAESRHRAEMLALEVMTERDALRTRLDAVERLANQWSKCASDGMLPAAAESIRAALATDAPASHDWRPELGKLVRVRSTGEVGRCINLDGLLAAVELDEIRWIAVNCLEPTVASPERGTGGEDFEPPCGRCKGRGVMWHERLERDVLCTYCQTKPVANATSRVKEP